tara:strand:+ start:250 stop:468 length:219 start_codon:yes stop_codon:yes gene_type:complete
MKKLILLLLFIPFLFTSCVDANPNIEVDNHINISIDGDNVDGIQGEWKITSIEKKEDGKEIIIIRIEKSDLQ